jgi:hypothetical protein
MWALVCWFQHVARRLIFIQFDNIPASLIVHQRNNNISGNIHQAKACIVALGTVYAWWIYIGNIPWKISSCQELRDFFGGAI